MGTDDPALEREFADETERLRRSGALGESGRLPELFDFLAGRGADGAPASQAEIAEAVFGQTETSVDDATVRVYIHRLRKRLDEHYAERGEGQARLAVPAGTYALRLQRAEADGAAATGSGREGGRAGRMGTLLIPGLALLAVALLGAAFLLGRGAPGGGAPANAIWQPFLDSERPKLIVVGDYYLFGEIDPVRPEEGRLIRDFRVDSPSDLLTMQELEPGRYGNSEDVGLNYLPFSTAYGLLEIAPILGREGHAVSVLAASELEPDMLNYFDVVYVGLFSGMALLEEVNFMASEFDIGESYDELLDTASGVSYVSEEARRLATPVYYRDYGYIARFRTPSGALVAVVAGARDTGLRGLVPLVTGAGLADEVGDAAGDGDFEALYQVTGQKGADLSERLLLARARRGEP